MVRLNIIVPSYGRPDNAERLLDRIIETSPIGEEVFVNFAVDFDDHTLGQYPEEFTFSVTGGSMVRALNELAVPQAEFSEYLAFLGDDTLPHEGWYPKIIEALESTTNSIVYGNDLIQGENLPTSVFMDANIVRTLGFMAPPNQKQLFVDNYWKALGRDLGTLIYLDDVIIEHLHPLVQKAPSDASYELSNSPERWKHDEDSFYAHITGQHLKDVEKLR